MTLIKLSLGDSGSWHKLWLVVLWAVVVFGVPVFLILYRNRATRRERTLKEKQPWRN